MSTQKYKHVKLLSWHFKGAFFSSLAANTYVSLYVRSINMHWEVGYYSYNVLYIFWLVP